MNILTETFLSLVRMRHRPMKLDICALLVALSILSPCRHATASELKNDGDVLPGIQTPSLKDDPAHEKKIEYSSASDISEKAEKGEAEAQYQLARCYQFGDGVKKDQAQSVEWARKAAEQGLAAAQNYMGLCYANGEGVKKDPVQAVAWFRKAADQGVANAQFCLGISYASGIGIEQDPVKAATWYRKAAEQGSAEAQNELGLAYASGVGVEQDSAEALKWVRKAAEQGLAEVQYNLGMCYKNGDGVEQDYIQALDWLEKAAKQGHAGAKYALGLCYERGEGVIVDLIKAVDLFYESAKQNYPWAQTQLAICYSQGIGVEKDPVQAVSWMRKAAEQGFASAQGLLGAYYMDGQGVVQDDREACIHFLIAGALGNTSSAEFVAQLRNGRLSAAEYNEARRLANAWMKSFSDGSLEVGNYTNELIGDPQFEKHSSTGSGFVISTDGYFLTCAHVIEDGLEIKVQLDANTYKAELIRSDKHNDIALLKLEGADFRPLALSPSFPEMGDKVFTVGFPNPELQGASAKYTDGVISSLFGIMDDVRTMQITVPIQGGSSGGPLVDANGNALGLVVAQLNAATVFEYTGTIPQNVNFAVKINYALPIVNSVPGLSQNLPKPRTATPEYSPVDDVRSATGLVLVSE